MAPLRIGVLVVPPIQLLDISPIDLFAMMCTSYFEACKLPQPILDLAMPDSDMTIAYISKSADPSPTTARLGLQINATLTDPKVAPGSLDILMIPGPPPGLKPEQEVLDFVRAHVEKGVELLTICSGVYVAAYAGVLDGKRATGTRGIQDHLDKEFPKVHWQDARYVRDGKVWSSGGITNGMDMVGWYMRERWPELADIVLKMADVDVRPAEYGESKAKMNAWFLFKIIKAWFFGPSKSKRE
ncbi:ThiJ/PfpI family protein [Periconia macrospinosa]|uniref:ThiJ/PfpI family protein n=1 Tax=Periconia macrospinosa TaxID=97972 RepID=A0A2V1DPB3_9PLEO|nr:ThiJ/PfpI family protein [Periconia macrospinosa]